MQSCNELPGGTAVDVLVVGGGPAGVCAALAAARQGASVLIIEQFNCLGGVATAGGHGHISSYAAYATELRVVGGIAHEIALRVEQAQCGVRSHYGIWFEVEGLKFLLENMVKDCGVQVLYYTQFCASLVEDGCLVGAVIQNKSGRGIVRAQRIIDCTGDGDVAASAGVPFEQGRPSDGKCQPVTLMFTIGGVDWPRVMEFRHAPGNAAGLTNIWERAQADRNMEPFQRTIMGWWWTPTRPDQVGINFTHITGMDATRAEDLTYATMEGRRQAYQTIDVYRRYIPGMEHCYMVSTPHTVGIRESRRILADVVMTERDMLAQRTWEDSVGYGSFFIDIHNIDGPGMDHTTVRPDPGFRYQIPYRILVPRGVDNLLTAGRCVSVTHIGLGSLRVMVPCMVMGEAAGTAAALSLHSKVPPRQLDVTQLVSVLRNNGAIIDEQDIAHANAVAPA